MPYTESIFSIPEILGGGSNIHVSLVRQLIDELKVDSNAQKELAERLALTISEDTNLRVLLLNALIAEAATKRDIESAKGELKQEISAVRSELKQEISELRADMRTYFYGFMGGILATILTVVLITLNSYNSQLMVISFL